MQKVAGGGDGRKLAAAYRAAARWLAWQAARIDALNVFPVPDGDTGTNMRLTMDAAVRALDAEPTDDAGLAAQRAAQAGLLGARGNSGVLLSQVLAGIAAAWEGHARLAPADIPPAAEEASRFAAKAVTNPVEGTMLTTLRETAAALASAPPTSDFLDLLRLAAATAHASVGRSPELLPQLREAGVVDAGAEGIAVLLDGMLRAAQGEPLEEVEPPAIVRPAAAAVAEGAHVLDDSGYCTNFIVHAAQGRIEELRSAVQALGSSVVVAGAATMIKVHLHTEHPGLALEAAAHLGDLTAIEVTNMRAQVATIQGERAGAGQPAAAALVAVVPSPELGAIFSGFGASTVLGGQTMNPSVSELLATIEATGAAHVFLLPNNCNIQPAAKRAAQEAKRRVTVVPTESIPQGVAAAVAFLADRPIEDNARAMEEARASVTTIEVTTASRAATLHGQAVAAGQAIALVDGALAAVADNPEAVALAAVEQTIRPEHSLITVYSGAGVPDERVSALREQLTARLPEPQLEAVRGAQPHYPYIIALE